MRPTLRVLLALSLAVNLLIALVTLAPISLTSAQPTEQYFPQTHHYIRGLFLKYWTEHGGVTQQGLPLTEEFQEQNKLNNVTYTVQYFERAIFERHPENAGTVYEVLLSQLGKFELDARYPNNSNPAAAPQSAPGGGQPTATVAPVATQPPAPVDDQAFAQFIAARYAHIGSRSVTFTKASFYQGTVPGVGNVPGIELEVGADDYSYLLQQVSKAELNTWAEAIEHELQVHWPGRPYVALLQWIHYSSRFDLKTDCHYVGNYDVNLGWYNSETVVSVSYIPSQGPALIQICGH